jgi:hypothetical protein
VGVSPAVFSDGKAVERNGPTVSAREVVNYAEGLSMRHRCRDRRPNTNALTSASFCWIDLDSGFIFSFGLSKAVGGCVR